MNMQLELNPHNSALNYQQQHQDTHNLQKQKESYSSGNFISFLAKIVAVNMHR